MTCPAVSAIVKDDVGRELKQGTSEDRGALVVAYRVQARLRDRLSTLGWFNSNFDRVMLCGIPSRHFVTAGR